MGTIYATAERVIVWLSGHLGARDEEDLAEELEKQILT